MARDGLRILDSDMHLMEPVDLWERYIDAKFKSQAPRGLTSENVRDLRMAHPDGRLWGLPQTHGKRNSNRGRNFQKNQGIYGALAERGWTAEVQLEADGCRGHRRRRTLSHAGPSSARRTEHGTEVRRRPGPCLQRLALRFLREKPAIACSAPG